MGYKSNSCEEYPYLQCEEGWVNDKQDVKDLVGIDCGEYEELFLAIAALRDDSDKFQYFTNGVFWIKCSQLELKHELDNNYEEFCVADFHKATVEELIEHFKK